MTDDSLRGLRRIALLDLRRGVRLAIAVQDDIDPQFRIATPNGDVAVAVTFPEGRRGRDEVFAKIRDLCAWKQALAYTMTFGIQEPDALMAVGVSALGIVACMTEISGEKGTFTEDSFGHPVWMAASSIGEEFAGLLPGRVSSLSDAALKELEAWFGPDGRFPAVDVASGGFAL